MNAAAAWLAGRWAPLRDDAIEQGELFQNLMRWDGAVRTTSPVPDNLGRCLPK